MITRNLLKTTVILVILTLTVVVSAFSQSLNFPKPEEEKLLNGLKLLTWNDPKAEKVTVKLRIHSGAAFDPKDKMGTMALLSDVLFPTQEARDFFREDLEGSLEISANYDYLQITATGKTDEVLAILETLAAAVTNPQLTKENFALVREARLAKVRELEKNPDYVADLAVAKRLFGDFPYGRSIAGTSESLTKIELADLLQVRDRLFTADNATIAVIGNVQPNFIYKATRRLFGNWKKSEAKVPATFRLPDAPDTTQVSIEMPDADRLASRVALNVPARSDKDFYATQILTRIWQKQFCLNNEASFGKAAYQPYLLRGFYVVSKNTVYGSEETPSNSSSSCQVLLQKDGKLAFQPISQGDFDAVKATLISEFQRRSAAEAADLWLDVDTYKLVSVKEEMNRLNSVTLGDVQRVAQNLQKEPLASVVIRKPGEAKQ